ncbi:DUF58 domain-containing protein [Chloroflexota bacterium]
MISLSSWKITVFLKIYVAIALVIVTIISPLALSFIPILLIVWYLYLWRWPITAVINLLTEYFMFFTIALLFTPYLGPLFSLLTALPVLLLINNSLEEAAESLFYQDTRCMRRPTDICLALLLIAMVTLGVSLLLSSLSLLLASVTIIGFLGILVAIVLRRLLPKPVEETQVRQRMVAGAEDNIYIRLTTDTKIGGLLFLESPYEWLEVSPNVLPLNESRLAVKVSLRPTLSGPSTIELNAYATDRWGLIQIRFVLKPIRLHVIPRATYAAWLVKRYLAGTKPGTLPLISNMEAIKPIYGLRRGVEYYGSQLYQPGDSLKNIDWKHSLKYNELITKEFAEFHGQSAIILVNLAVGNAEEADKLAYNIIVTAISLARENIPAAMAAYDHEDVRVITPTLQPRQLLIQSLQVAQEMVTFITPMKYLNPPDVGRLRANISRIRFVESSASKVLTQLLQLEYKNLNDNARLNPATKALTQAFTKAGKQSNIVIISQRNHDAEALAFNTFEFARKGNAIITV